MPTYYWDAEKDALLQRARGISFRDVVPPIEVDGDDPWPFPDDLDDYERHLEASVAAGEWRSVPNFPAEKARYEAIARATIAVWSPEPPATASEQSRPAPAGRPPGNRAGPGLSHMDFGELGQDADEIAIVPTRPLQLATH